eukprot:m.41392 g.41392  ORF g.41392 m.41392 type:complete len:50 (+) comp33151_c0_seq1:878-1027(+)
MAKPPLIASSPLKVLSTAPVCGSITVPINRDLPSADEHVATRTSTDILR